MTMTEFIIGFGVVLSFWGMGFGIAAILNVLRSGGANDMH